MAGKVEKNALIPHSTAVLAKLRWANDPRLSYGRNIPLPHQRSSSLHLKMAGKVEKNALIPHSTAVLAKLRWAVGQNTPLPS